MNSTPPKRPKKARFARHQQIAERIAELKSESDALAREQREIEKEIELYVNHCEPKKRCMDLFGYRLEYERKAGSVSWKNAYIALAGADEAARLTDEAKADGKEKFRIRRASGA